MKQGGVKFISVLRRALVLLGCFIFLWSVVSPFYRYARIVRTQIPEVRSFMILYWSFTEKIAVSSDSIAAFLDGGVAQQRWFLDYWFGNFDIKYLGYFLLHPAMFVAQVVTLATGVFSVSKSNRKVAAVCAAACLTTLLLMICQNVLMSDTNMEPYYYRIGYWLAYPSLILFIINFLLTLISHRSKTELRVSGLPTGVSKIVWCSEGFLEEDFCEGFSVTWRRMLCGCADW